MKLRMTVLIMVAFAVSAPAQEPKSRDRGADQQAVVNDDGGQAFVIGTESTTLANLSNHGAVISEPRQYSIFLGNGWRKAPLREREPELANLLSNISDQAQLNALNEAGIKNVFGATSSQEKLDDLAVNISDLEIQKVLAGMLRDGTFPQSNANTIYVLFLDPKLHSTLGSMIARKHYLAYHNFFNASGLKIHYVVVPFESDPETGYQIALRAFVAAALNPAGFPVP